jgi:hypothetical protein
MTNIGNTSASEGHASLYPESWAGGALEAFEVFEDQTGAGDGLADAGGVSRALCALIANLGHLADEHGLNFEMIMAQALSSYVGMIRQPAPGAAACPEAVIVVDGRIRGVSDALIHSAHLKVGDLCLSGSGAHIAPDGVQQTYTISDVAWEQVGETLDDDQPHCKLKSKATLVIEGVSMHLDADRRARWCGRC